MIWRVARQQEAAALRRPYREYGQGVTATPAPARRRQAPRGIVKRPPGTGLVAGGEGQTPKAASRLGRLHVVDELVDRVVVGIGVIDLDERLPLVGQRVLGKDRLDRALGLTGAAID